MNHTLIENLAPASTLVPGELPLAKTEVGGLIFIVITIIVMVVSALANALNKKIEEERRRIARETIEREAGRRTGATPLGGPTPERPQIPRSLERILTMPMPAPPPKNHRNDPRAQTRPQRAVQQQQPPRRQAKPQRKKPPAAPPRQGPPAIPQQHTHARAAEQASAAFATAPGATHQDISAGEIRSMHDAGSARARPASMAGALNLWLRPSTLRQQFILTELLRPPVSLREPDA